MTFLGRFANRHIAGGALIAAHDFDGGLLADAELLRDVAQVVVVLDGLAVKLQNDVVTLDAGFIAGTALNNSFHDRALCSGHLEVLPDLLGDRSGEDTSPRPLD